MSNLGNLDIPEFSGKPTAPRYVSRADRRVEVQAVRFVEGLPGTHWNVNFGHPTIKALRHIYWVQGNEGVIAIKDGDWVVKSNRLGFSVWSDSDFFSTFQPYDDYE